MTTNPRIAVLGPGAIGTTVAAALHDMGRTPFLAGRSAREHLRFRDGDRYVVVPGPVHTDPSESVGPVDVIFLAVKATQVEAAAPWLAALSGPDTTICVLQNGVEQVPSVSPFAASSVVVPSVVWFPAEAQPDGSVQLRGAARLTVPETEAGRTIAEALRGTLCAVDLSDDFTTAAWRKLVQNAVAGLMVLTGRRAGMFRRGDVAQVALAYLRECLAVARAEGAILGDEVPGEILETFRAFPTDMGTSILADRDAERPLEWDVRNGVIQRRGRAHGIPTPVSDVVVSLLAAASDGPG